MLHLDFIADLDPPVPNWPKEAMNDRLKIDPLVSAWPEDATGYTLVPLNQTLWFLLHMKVVLATPDLDLALTGPKDAAISLYPEHL